MHIPMPAALFLCTCLGAHAAADEQHIGLIKNVSGAVRVERGGATLAADPGMQLRVSDRLVSGPADTAGVVFRDGTLLSVGPSSVVHLRDYVFEPKQSRYRFDLFLAKGSAVYASGKIGKLSPESVRVDTPAATVGVRGTRFLIQAE
ncbi:FecR family protein [Aquincola sp. MAHUQ-54]|uniref:FecR family protein n=1 Tax=Aquincola agrisoli TaxID=3119538 RepID=A0AAW9QIJ4_9BURK